MTRQNSDPYDDFFELVSKLTISRIRALSQTGEKVNAVTLADALRSEADIRRFIDNKMGASDNLLPSNEIPGEVSDKIAELKSRKAVLVKELDELEFRMEQKDQFCRKALLLMAGLSSTPGNASFQQQIDDFKLLVKNNAEIPQLENAFTRLKNEALKEIPGDTETSGEPMPLETAASDAVRPAPETGHQAGDEVALPDERALLTVLKTAYLDLIQGLRLSLGEAYVERMARLSTRVEGIRAFGEISEIRKDIIGVLRGFIDNISTEREAAAAAVIHEISRQVNEMELFLADSLDQAGKTRQSNEDFNSRMAAELKELNQSANFSQTLEELKTAVVTKLAHIKAALEKKNAEDELRNADIALKIERLRQGLTHMKNEADAAHQKVGRLKKQLLLDPLTGAFNRKAYNDRIEDEMERYLRYHRLFSVLLFDIDHFKNINDGYGHAIGDKCLQEITRRTKALIRQNDLLFRIGGEEFVVILPETDRTGALQVAEKLRKTIEFIDFILKKKTLKITISIGLTTVSTEDRKVSSLFNRVDAAMYEAKQKGRNCVVQK